MSAALPNIEQTGNRELAVHSRSVEHQATRGAPIIVLTYPHAGADRLWSLLAASPALACTSGTGVLRLCEQASFAWRQAEGRAGEPLSQIAITSTRVLTTSIITSILARLGKHRWCEFAIAPPSTAESFLQIHPGTRFLCLHRSYTDVIFSAINATAWGLEGQEFAAFTAAYPASSVAALTAFWIARTEALITFEESHPELCHRVRYEDISAATTDVGLFDFIAVAPVSPLTAVANTDASGTRPRPRPAFPFQHVPAPLLSQANVLLDKLGYLPLTSDPTLQLTT